VVHLLGLEKTSHGIRAGLLKKHYHNKSLRSKAQNQSSATVRQRNGLSHEGLNRNSSTFRNGHEFEDHLQGAQNYPTWK
jgi:hypothetical protein